MNLAYHIFYRPKGQKGSQLSSITPTRADIEGQIVGYASGGFVRDLWERMNAQAIQTGWMKHPSTGEAIEFASLQYGGHVDRQGAGQGGQCCQKWEHGAGRQMVFEPEPELYDPETRRRLALMAEPAASEQYDDVPEIPTPAGPMPAATLAATEQAAVDNVSGLDAYGSSAPAEEESAAEKLAAKAPRRKKSSATSESV